MLTPSTPIKDVDLNQQTAALSFVPLDKSMGYLQGLVEASDDELGKWAKKLHIKKSAVNRLRGKLRWVLKMTNEESLLSLEKKLKDKESADLISDTRGRILATLHIENGESISAEQYDKLDEEKVGLQRELISSVFSEEDEVDVEGGKDFDLSNTKNFFDEINVETKESRRIAYRLEYIEKMLEKIINSKADKMHSWGRRADQMLKDAVSRFFPGGKSRKVELLPSNDVTPLSDIAELIAIVFDDDWEEAQRFKADRKLELMLLCQTIDNILMERKEDLKYLSKLLQDRVYHTNGHKKGHTEVKYLVTTHNPDHENRCTDDYGFLDKEPDFLANNQYIETVSFRTIEIELENGETKKIDFMVHLDQKDELSILLKAIRYPDRPLSRIFRDFNRGRFLFKSEEDQELVINEIERRFKGGYDGLTRHEVSVGKVKSGVGGTAENPTINCYKFNMTIDGRDYEFQSFSDPKEYANYFLINNEENDAWCQNEILRFFKLASYVLFPESQYPGLNREVIMIEAMKLAYEGELFSRGADLKSDSANHLY